MQYMQIFAMIFGALGGLELIKFLATRRSARRQEEATAEIDEAKADDAQLENLRKHIDWLQAQLEKKEERFAEQTDLVRKLQTEVLVKSSEVVKLNTERDLKLCERRNCAKREPQSGY